MTSNTQIPFSARYSGEHHQIDGDFPRTARIALLHLLLDLVEQQYVLGWHAIARELQRIARRPATTYDTLSVESIEKANEDAHKLVWDIGWDRVYDFCERLYSHLVCEVGDEGQYGYVVLKSKSEVQAYVTDELKRMFLEERLAFDFSDGLVRRQGRKHTVNMTTKAQVVLSDSCLSEARKHYDKALQFFRHPSAPDYENCVKECVCAVEAAGRALFPMSKANTLGDLAKWLGNTSDVTVPKAIAQTITSVYAYRSGGNGIGHGGAEGGIATLEVTEYVLAVCASQIIFLVDISKQLNTEVPF
ncbi:hypothetical protein [Massilia timonae]|uniref:hypothetical protein n=1 Tax=Massilia timonae TaxID=47229 RepID=UPI002352B45F|nr:hypothetical protein [Massilia timonae]